MTSLLDYAKLRKLKKRGNNEDFYEKMIAADKEAEIQKKLEDAEKKKAMKEAMSAALSAKPDDEATPSKVAKPKKRKASPSAKAAKKSPKTAKAAKPKPKAPKGEADLYSRLTDEQKDFVDCTMELIPGKLIRVIATAGSGKTTAIKAFVIKRPNKKFLYLVFNRNMRAEAVKKFRQQTNVSVHTYHSLAFAVAITVHGYKMFFPKPGPGGCKFYNQAIQAFMKKSGIYDDFAVKYKLVEKFAWDESAHPWENRALWNHAMWTLDKFCGSGDDSVTEEHCVKLKELLKKKENIDQIQDERTRRRVLNAITPNIKDVITLAKYIVSIIVKKEFMVINQNISIKLLHLLNPDLSSQSDIFTVDEGQDMSPIMIKVISKQKMAWIVVGDPLQQINRWMGACNALDKLGALIPAEDQVTFFFSETFRFGPLVADFVNKLFKKVGYGVKKPVRSNVTPDSAIHSLEDDVDKIAKHILLELPTLSLAGTGDTTTKKEMKIGVISRTKYDILAFLNAWIQQLTEMKLDLHYFTVRCSAAVKADFDGIVKLGQLNDRELASEYDKVETQYAMDPNDEDIKGKRRMLLYIMNKDNRQEYVRKVDQLIHPRKNKAEIEADREAALLEEEGDVDEKEDVEDADDAATEETEEKKDDDAEADDAAFYAQMTKPGKTARRPSLAEFYSSESDEDAEEKKAPVALLKAKKAASPKAKKATSPKAPKAPKSTGRKIILEMVTIHASKGLEYDHVIGLGLDRDLGILKERADQVVREKNSGIKEVRRIAYNDSLFLIYVLITRVIHTLFLPQSVYNFIESIE